MAAATKGEFLHEKFGNMARWVTQEVGEENLPVDVIAGIAGRSAVEVTTLCGILGANSDQVTTRNFSGLLQLMQAHHLPDEVQQVVTAVQQRKSMHEKFWRYMDLFVTVARQ